MIAKHGARRSCLRTAVALVTAGIALGAILLANVAYAMPPNYCANYTRSAIREYQRAMANPGCRGAVNDLPIRWHDNYSIHFNWCLAQTYEGTISEKNARLDVLRICYRSARVERPAATQVGCCPNSMLVCPLGRSFCH